MYRKLALPIIVSAVLASPVAWSATPSDREARPATANAGKNVSRAAHKKDKESGMVIKAKHEVVALAPVSDTQGWGGSQLAMAGPADIPPAEISRIEAPTVDENINVYGMLLAALGLGAMSIVRRMGRF